ncbi:MAG: hypothetical protein WEB59_06130 [Thermoanaerobaculia bacterium]
MSDPSPAVREKLERAVTALDEVLVELRDDARAYSAIAAAAAFIEVALENRATASRATLARPTEKEPPTGKAP